MAEAAKIQRTDRAFKERAMAEKITKARLAMLQELDRHGSPQPYAASYAPIRWLVAQGFANHSVGKYGSDRFEISPEGRAALALSRKDEANG